MAKSKMTSKAQPIHVDIVSDVVCPWCWLGARYFQKAIKQFGGKAELTWRPYMLDASVPKEGLPYRDYMKTKFGEAGPDSRWTAMREHLETAGPQVGIEFNFKGITIRPNTLDAHRLIRWAQGQGKAGAMTEALFHAAFTDNSDIGDADILSDLAETAGLDGGLVAELLGTDKDITAVQNEIFHFRNLGVSGVPTFIYNGQFAVQSAQPPETHLKALKQATEKPMNS